MTLTFQEITHPEDLRPDVNSVGDVMARRTESYTMFKRYRHGRTGAWVWMHLSVGGVFDPDSGEFLYFLSQISRPVAKDLRDSQWREIQEIQAGLNNNEFTLFYQPIVEIATGRIVGFEGLGRWLRKGDVVSPGQWLPLLELAELTHELSKVVARIAADWRGPGFLSVNIDPLSIDSPDWPDIAALLPAGTHIEITEIRELSEAGKLLISSSADALPPFADDFGTGFSNYAQLEWLIGGGLKIDASLVRDIVESKRARAVCAAIIQLASAWGLEVIAEGVEAAEVAQALQQMGCPYGQGYYWGKPLPEPIAQLGQT